VQVTVSPADLQVEAAFERAAIGMCLQDFDSRVLRANEALCKMLGYTRKQLLALPPAAITHPDDWPQEAAQRERMRTGISSGFSHELRLLRRDRGVLWARVTCEPMGQGDSRVVFTQIEDMGDRRQALLALHASEEQARVATQRLRQQDALLDQSRDAIVVHLLDGTLRYWNKGAERMFGFTRDQALGRSFDALMGPGARLDAAAAAHLQENGEWTGELVCVDAGGQMLIVERRCTLVPPTGGGPATVLTVNSDVTERRRAAKEIVLLNNVLEQRIRSRTAQLEESNEDLRDFAYSLAHDLRAPLASIDGFSAQLEQRLGASLDEKSRHYLSRVRAGVHMMSDLTDALLELADLSNTQLLHQSLDLSVIARAITDRLREHEPLRNVSITIEDTPRTQGDVRLLTDVLENLLGNAWKFTSKKPSAQIAFGSQAWANGASMYYVKDNGAGFDPAYAYKLFGPFQRLHAANEFAGTGIGLAMVRKIVSRHGGRVWAESVQGEGATFFFTLNENTPAAV
jgi:PAS domain S-box-containing protein